MSASAISLYAKWLSALHLSRGSRSGLHRVGDRLRATAMPSAQLSLLPCCLLSVVNLFLPFALVASLTGLSACCAASDASRGSTE